MNMVSSALRVWTPRSYHPPGLVPTLPGGVPTTKPLNEHAVDTIIRMVHKYPGEVTLWAGGPLTGIASSFAESGSCFTRQMTCLMGSGFNVGMGGIHQDQRTS